MAGTIGSVTTVDFYGLNIYGDPGTSARFVRETRDTLGTSSRTTVTEHKYRWEFDLRNISTADRDIIIAAFNAASFTFIASPYDATSYTCKCVNPGKWRYRENTTAYHDCSGIIIEVA